MMSERQLIDEVKRLADDGPAIIAIAGLPGAGKTTLAKRLAATYSSHAMQVSEDNFCTVPTKERKMYLRDALIHKDFERLRYLATPSDVADNPYADPLSWYDWQSLSECLHTLRAGKTFTRQHGWNQITGECDRMIEYAPPLGKPFLCFVDANYPLEYGDAIDRIVFIDISPQIATERQALRDAHRSDHTYLAYKQMIDDLYCKPYLEKVRMKADYILTPSTVLSFPPPNVEP